MRSASAPALAAVDQTLVEVRWLLEAQRRPASLDFDVASARDGHVLFSAGASGWSLNPNGALHGGLVTAGVEFCAAVAAATAQSGEREVRANSVAVSFLRPAIPPLTFDTHLHSNDGVTSFATVEVTAADGRTCASAQATLSLVEGGPPDGQASAVSPQLPRTDERAPFIPGPHGGSTEDWIHWAENLSVSCLMDLRCMSIEPNRSVVRLEPPHPDVIPGSPVREGLVAAWADHCFGIVATTAVPPGTSPATATLAAQFVRPALAPLTFEATVLKSGRTLAFIDVRVRGATEDVVAIVRGTMSVDGTSRFLPAKTA